MSRPPSPYIVALVESLRDLAADKSHHKASSFTNPWPSFTEYGFKSAGRMLMDWDRSRSKPVALPVFPINHAALAVPPAAPQLTWLGHACFLLQIRGVNVLTDPVFSHRCSPVQFVGPARYVPAPLAVPALPRIDVVIISHNHYDHLDSGTISELAAAWPAAEWFVPSGNKELVKSLGVTKVHELDWWEHVVLPGKAPGESVLVVCTPCQHFSGRGLLDRCKTLWASWSLVFEGEGAAPYKFFFGGDTGYRAVPRGFEDSPEARAALPSCPVFKRIGAVLGPFDLAAVPIGAYSPRWFMSPIHCDPIDAVDLHIDIRSKQSVGMHWGTWILTDEPVLEPPRLLASTLAARGLPPDSFVTFSHGETRVMPVAPAAAQRGQEEEGKEREEGKEGEGATPVLPFGSVAAASDAKL